MFSCPALSDVDTLSTFRCIRLTSTLTSCIEDGGDSGSRRPPGFALAAAQTSMSWCRCPLDSDDPTTSVSSMVVVSTGDCVPAMTARQTVSSVNAVQTATLLSCLFISLWTKDQLSYTSVGLSSRKLQIKSAMAARCSNSTEQLRLQKLFSVRTVGRTSHFYFCKQ